MNVLRCANLHVSFESESSAIANLTSTLSSSGITAIIGPNGAGKTTLLNVLTGFLKPASGEVFWLERNICGMPPHAIARLGISRTFQDSRLISQLTVLENVLFSVPGQRRESFARALFGFRHEAEERQNREKALSTISFVGLRRERDKPAGLLSYGQQKLLALACCLATEAQILLLDEPVAGVHPEAALEIAALLDRIRREGKQVMLIEHDLDFVQKTADFLVVMDRGRIVAEGPPSAILNDPVIIRSYVD